MLEMLKPGLVDFVCAFLALAWALACLPLPALEVYCSGGVAFAGFMGAAIRGIALVRKNLPALEG